MRTDKDSEKILEDLAENVIEQILGHEIFIPATPTQELNVMLIAMKYKIIVAIKDIISEVEKI